LAAAEHTVVFPPSFNNREPDSATSPARGSGRNHERRPSDGPVSPSIILGVIPLVIIGFIAKVAIIWMIGIIVGVIGAILA